MIDERAVVSPDAVLHEDVTVGAYSIVGAEVEIGPRTRIEPHAVIKGPTRIGADNHIYQFASIGDDPQDKKYAGERTELVIGDRNTIREYCTINRGTAQDTGFTRIGSDNWIMAYAHIAHDCVIGDRTIFANGATLAGHVTVGDHALLGGFTGVHQFCRIGESAMLSMYSHVAKDVPAFVLVSGGPAVPRGINTEGLRRRGFSADEIRGIRAAYRTVYREGRRLEDAIDELERRAGSHAALRVFVESLRGGRRGVVR